MKLKFTAFALVMMVFFSLSNASSISVSVTSTLTSISPKNDKQKAIMTKFLSSKIGKLIIKKLEKRHARLSTKLAIAEKAGDVKKVKRIKQRMSAKGDLVRVGLWILLGGVLGVIIGVGIFLTGINNTRSSLGPGYFLGLLLIGLGQLAFLVGLIILIIGLIQG